MNTDTKGNLQISPRNYRLSVICPREAKCLKYVELGWPSAEQFLKQINDTIWGTRKMDTSQKKNCARTVKNDTVSD